MQLGRNPNLAGFRLSEQNNINMYLGFTIANEEKKTEEDIKRD